MSSGEAEHYAACTAAQQIIGTENMARELAVHLDAMELQVGAIGIIGRQGFGELRHLDLSYWWLQCAVRKRVNLKKVQSESNMADLGTQALEKAESKTHGRGV